MFNTDLRVSSGLNKSCYSSLLGCAGPTLDRTRSSMKFA